MKISSRFSIAIHILMCIDVFKQDYKVTSEFIASSVNVNPVIIRNILGQLKEDGIVEVARGTGGAIIIKDYSSFTLLDIFNCVDSLENNTLFGFHGNPNPECPVGKNIHFVVDGYLEDSQKALEKQLAKTTFKELIEKMNKKL